MDPSLVAMQVFSGLALGAVLVMSALGLSIVFGMLGVVNFAHGALFMVGAYVGVYVADLTGSYWWAFVAAPISCFALGLLIERLLIRPLAGRPPDDAILLTFGLAYILVEVVRILFGTDGLSASPPPELAGVVDLGIGFFPLYRLFVIGVVVAVLLALWATLEGTRFGLIVRAGVVDPEIMRVLGVDMGRLRLLVFALGIGLTALGGVLAGPMRSINPEMGTAVLGEAFVVTVIGGLGSIAGVVASGLGLGVVVSLTALVAPEMASIALFGLMAAVLIVRPQGLFGRPPRRV